MVSDSSARSGPRAPTRTPAAPGSAGPPWNDFDERPRRAGDARASTSATLSPRVAASSARPGPHHAAADDDDVELLSAEPLPRQHPLLGAQEGSPLPGSGISHAERNSCYSSVRRSVPCVGLSPNRRAPPVAARLGTSRLQDGYTENVSASSVDREAVLHGQAIGRISSEAIGATTTPPITAPVAGRQKILTPRRNSDILALALVFSGSISVRAGTDPSSILPCGTPTAAISGQGEHRRRDGSQADRA